jgi:hypothetical protein
MNGYEQRPTGPEAPAMTVGQWIRHHIDNLTGTEQYTIDSYNRYLRMAVASALDHAHKKGLPKKMFELLGGRLTGRLAVSFIPSRTQTADSTVAWTPEPAPLLAHSVVYADGGSKWVPGSSSFVALRLAPQRGRSR